MGYTKIDFEQFFEDLRHTLPAALVRYELYPDGSDKTTYLSQWCEGLWEHSEEEIAKNPSILWKAVHPDDIEEMVAKVKASAENLSLYEHIYRLKTKSGKIKYVEGRGQPHLRKDGTVYWNTFIIEVTAQQKAQMKLNAQQKKLNKALREIIRSVGRALEVTDSYTAGHQERVAKISDAIARKMGLGKDLRYGLVLGALVHDIGKIHVPAEILTKATSLTAGEMALIREHPETGAKIFNPDLLPWPINDIIIQHHERLDGSGYPKGLSDQEIILEARIVAVADVFEAMSTMRPYRPSLGCAAAMKELNDFKNVKYDPAVVDALNEIIDEGETFECTP